MIPEQTLKSIWRGCFAICAVSAVIISIRIYFKVLDGTGWIILAVLLLVIPVIIVVVKRYLVRRN